MAFEPLVTYIYIYTHMHVRVQGITSPLVHVGFQVSSAFLMAFFFFFKLDAGKSLS